MIRDDDAERIAFQPTLPRGERPGTPDCGSASGGFNPRSRAGSDVHGWCYSWRPMLFQPTLPRGERRVHPRDHRAQNQVSTHAPARGATASRREISRRILCFNPRSRAGSDKCFFFSACAGCGFNPRSRAGSDFGSVDADIVQVTFQPTLPRGERLLPGGCVRANLSVSTHAPARGATVLAVAVRPTAERFNPRSRAGSDTRVSK